MSDSNVDGASESHTARAFAHSQALRGDARALAGELREAVGELQARLDLPGRMERSPYLTLAVAAGAGYVLGGGLFSRFSGQVLRLGVRLMLVPLVREELRALGETASLGPSPH